MEITPDLPIGQEGAATFKFQQRSGLPHDGIGALWDGGSYEYDGLSQIRCIGVTPEPGTHPQSYAHDAHGRLAMAQLPGSTLTYGFDAFGNMSSRTGAPWPSTIEGGFSGRVFQSSGVHDNRIHDAGWTHDASGNVTAEPGGRTMAWDGLSRLRQVSGAGGNLLGRYGYDVAGERVLSQEPDGWHFTFRGGGAQSQAEYIWTEPGGWILDCEYCLGPEGEYAELKHGALVEPEYYGKDHLGTPRVATDASGAIIALHLYEPFGIEKPLGGGVDLATHRFTGHERDEPTGLDDMHARYFAAEWSGRFLSGDPIATWEVEDPQTWNRYTYVTNAPIGSVDPDGEFRVLAQPAAWAVRIAAPAAAPVAAPVIAVAAGAVAVGTAARQIPGVDAAVQGMFEVMLGQPVEPPPDTAEARQQEEAAKNQKARRQQQRAAEQRKAKQDEGKAKADAGGAGGKQPPKGSHHNNHASPLKAIIKRATRGGHVSRSAQPTKAGTSSMARKQRSIARSRESVRVEKIDEALRTANWRGAERLLRGALRREPESHWLRAQLSSALHEQRRYAEALVVAREAHELVPKCWLTNWALAGALEATGDVKAAIRLWKCLLARGSARLGSSECGEGLPHARCLLNDARFRIGLAAQRSENWTEGRRYLLTYLRMRSACRPSAYSRKEALELLAAMR